MLCSTGLCRQGRWESACVDQTPAESQSPRGEENGATRAPPSRAAAARQPRAARAAMLHLQGAALAMHPLHGPATGPCPPRSACTAAASGAINRAAGARSAAPRAPAARTESMCALPCSSCGVLPLPRSCCTAESAWVVCRAPVARRRGGQLSAVQSLHGRINVCHAPRSVAKGVHAAAAGLAHTRDLRD